MVGFNDNCIASHFSVLKALLYKFYSVLNDIYNQVLNKIKLRLEFRHERGVYKYDESMINV